MTDSDLLIDDEPAPRKKTGRPTRAEAEAKRLAQMKEPLPHYSEFRKPVGITFLANIFGKQPKQIQKMLEKCPIHSFEGHNSPRYDFLVALSYLVSPKGDIESFLAQKNTANLPPYINKMWWDSAAQRNRVLVDANDLWHTEDVMVVFGRVANMIRSQTNMWIEDLPEKDLLSNEQYNALVDAKNRLIDEVRETLLKLPRETLSMTAHIKSELEASGTMISDDDRPAEDVDEDE